MTLHEIKSLFLKGDITKADFIEKMQNLHKSLWDYAGFLKNSDISKIEISDDTVIMTSRKTDYQEGGIRFYCGQKN